MEGASARFRRLRIAGADSQACAKFRRLWVPCPRSGSLLGRLWLACNGTRTGRQARGQLRGLWFPGSGTRSLVRWLRIPSAGARRKTSGRSNH